MLMPINRIIYAVNCPKELVDSMQKTAEEICGIQDAEWRTYDVPTEDMRGHCIILSGSDYVQTAAQWTSDTEVLWIAEKTDMTFLRQGFVDILTLPLDMERFAASFSNMLRRCDLNRRVGIRENQLKAYYEISDDMLWTKDLNDLHMDINHILIGLSGKSREQIEGKHETEIYGLDPDDEGCKESDRYVRTTGKTNFFEESMPGADGQLHHLRVTKAPWLDGQGRVIGTIGLAKDVTELMNQQAKFNLFLNSLDLGIVIVDNEGTVMQANKVYLNMVGTKAEETVGYKAARLNRRKLEKSTEFDAEDYIVIFPDGKKTVWNLSYFKLNDYWGNPYGYTYIFENVTMEREQRKKIINMAIRDQLTGIPNRTGMYEYFSTIDKSDKATFMFIDIDNFKFVNDNFGHDVGDSLLKDVADLFCAVLPSSFIARMGGDEFIAIIDGSVELQNIRRKAEALLKGIKQLAQYPAEMLAMISLSIGILPQFPLKSSLDEIIRKSDKAMYRAKRTGKNKYCF